MKVRIATPLRSYTGRQAEVDAEGATVADLLADLERRYPGIRFRLIDEQGAVRRHMRIYVNREQIIDLATPVRPTDQVHILQALSGG